MPASEDSEVLTDTYGVFLDARLEAAGPELAHVDEAFGVVQERLEAAHDARTGLEKSLVRAEAMRVESETAVEQTLGSIDLSVLAASGRKRTAEPYVATFPKGLTGAIEPRGRAQLAEATRIANHLAPVEGASPAGVTDAIKTEVATLRERLANFARRPSRLARAIPKDARPADGALRAGQAEGGVVLQGPGQGQEVEARQVKRG
jgi:hypothetical protein